MLLCNRPAKSVDKKSEMATNKHRQVVIEYTLGTEDEILEATPIGRPLKIELGSGVLHPGLEARLESLKAGEEFSIRLDPNLGFGGVNPELIVKMNRQKLPESLRSLKVGDAFEAPGPDGKKKIFRVTLDENGGLTLDANHPYAGLDLIFEGKVLQVLEIENADGGRALDPEL